MSLQQRSSHPIDKQAALIAVGGVVDKNGRGVGRKLGIPAHQVVVHSHVSKVVRIPRTNGSISDGLFTGGNNEYIFKVEKDATTRQSRQTLRFKIEETASASMVLAPVYRWFERIELGPQKGDENQLKLYDDNLEVLVRLAGSDEDTKPLSRRANFNNNADTLFNGVAQTHKAGETRWYDLPLHTFLEKVNFNPQLFKTDYQIKLYGKNGIKVSGSGTPKLTDVELIVEVEDDNHNFPHEDKQLQIHNTVVPRYDFYEPTIAYDETMTLTASTDNYIDLEDLTGDVGFLMLRIRAGKSNTANEASSNVDLGPDALLDITDSNKKTIWSNGANADYILFHQTRSWFPNNFCSRSYLYPIAFCDNPQDAMYHGITHGYMNFDSKKYLRITPHTAPTSWVYSVDLSNGTANDGGTIRFTDPLGNSTGDLAFNTTTANLKIALDALPYFAENGLTSTFSATVVSDFTITIAGRDLSLMEGKTIGVHSKLTQSTNATGVNAVTCSTIGRRGFTTGSYRVTVYGWVHKKISNIGSTLLLA
jgi:hypothetical protein